MHKKDFKNDSPVPYFRLFFVLTPSHGLGLGYVNGRSQRATNQPEPPAAAAFEGRGGKRRVGKGMRMASDNRTQQVG